MRSITRSAFVAGAFAAVAIVSMLATQGRLNASQAPTSLQEIWEDWRVACVHREGAGRLCAMSQTQVQGEGGQRILALEITVAPGEETATGTLLLPFGLMLDDGVSLEIDDASFAENLRFRTCFPSGCVVPIIIFAEHLSALRKGASLNILTSASDTGQPVSFTVSLRGFTAAFDRLVELRG